MTILFFTSSANAACLFDGKKITVNPAQAQYCVVTSQCNPDPEKKRGYYLSFVIAAYDNEIEKDSASLKTEMNGPEGTSNPNGIFLQSCRALLGTSPAA